jgi:cytochrome c oxidase cbb3-type subunit 4
MKEGMACFTDTHLTVLGLILFFVFFLGVLIWTSLKGNKENYKKLQQIPLNDGE